MSNKTKAGMIRELTTEYDIIMGRAAQIKTAILMLQAIETDEPVKPRTKVWRVSSLKGVVLGNIPVTPVKRPNQGSKKIKRKYTKKAEFWKKPHPSKKK
jgi:hypothetical protein